MIGPEHPYSRTVYVFLAALAGAITSVSFLKWREMSPSEVAMTVFVGLAFALIVVPWITIDVLSLNNADSLRAGCALTYLGATCAPSIIPVIITRVKKLAAKFSMSEDAKHD